MFTADQDRLRELYARLQGLQDNGIAFEKRFEAIRLHYPFEDLVMNHSGRPGVYHYCFYVNARGVRFVGITENDAEIARKMKAQEPLSWLEKERALSLLLRLSTGEVLHADLGTRPIFYGNG